MTENKQSTKKKGFESDVIFFEPKFADVREHLEVKHPRIANLRTQRNQKPIVTIVALELVEAIKYLGFKIKQNIRNQRTLTVKDNQITYFDDNLEAKFDAELELELLNHNLKYGREAFEKGLKVMMADNKLCPFQDKLEKVKWDGTTRLTNEYINQYFKDEDGVFGDYLKAFMVATIGRIYDGYFQSPVWILAGNQGVGKSYFTKWLSSVFGQGGHAERHINPDNKDDLAICCETVIVEIAEAISTFKKDREILKKHFTAGFFYFRNPYGRYNIQRPHCSSYIATANLSGLGILKDPTGNRRFIICEMVDIIKDYSNDIDPIQLWAEAYQIYQTQKASLNLNYESMIDTEKRDLINARFASRPIEYDDLDEIVEYTGDSMDRIKPKDLIDNLQTHTVHKDRNILKAIVYEYLMETHGVKMVKAKLNGVPTNVFKGIKFIEK
jgi:predicted P-loop ATPase